MFLQFWANQILRIGGEEWFNNNHWLSYEHHECHWFAAYKNEFWGTTEADIWYDAPPSSRPCRNMSNLNMDGQYEHLWLYSNYLVGTVPLELYLLTSLKR